MTPARVHTLAATITERLQAQALLDVSVSQTALVDVVARAMTTELSVEDRLNDEIRALLKQHDAEMQRTGSDYQQTFQMIKKKLVNDRGLVL